MSDKYNSICVRVVSDKELGSGFLIKSLNHYYVITAFHCIGDKYKMELYDDIQVWCNQGSEKVTFYFDRNDIKFFPHIDETKNIDLAIIQLSGKVMLCGKEKKIESIDDYNNNSLVIDTNLNKEIDIKLVGFPKSNKREGHLTLERATEEIKKYCFDKEIGSFYKSDYNFKGDQTFGEYLKGYSGSGMFLEIENTILLVGIFIKYKSGENLGTAISPIKLIELFKLKGLELPITTDSYIQIKLEEIVNTIIEEELVENPSLKLKCNKFKEKIYNNKEKIEKIAKGLSKKNYNKPIEKYIKSIIEKLFLLEHFGIEYNLDGKKLSINLNEISLKIFQCEETRYKIIKSIFTRFRIEEWEKISEKERIYIKGISNKDNSDFKCGSCPYESEKKSLVSLIKNKILPNISRNSSEKGFDIIEGDNKKQLEIRCGDCLDLDKRDELKGRKSRLWS